MLDLKNYFCVNEQCSQYGLKNNGNIVKSGTYGKHHRQMLQCNVCKKRFSETHNTVFFGSKYSAKTIRSILVCIAEGNGIRATGRILHLSKDSVNDIVLKASKHCEYVLDNLLSSLNLEQCQMDELWSFVQKKKARSKSDRKQQFGHVSLWIAFDPVSKLEVFHRADDQTLDACRAFIKGLIGRLTNIPFFSSDELGHYMVALFEAYRIDPEIEWDFFPYAERYKFVHPELDYAVFHKERRDGRVVSTKQIVLFGDEKRILAKLKDSPSKTINTSFVERYNGILRGLCANLIRRSQCFSKDFTYFCSRISIVSVYYNFIRPHGTLSKRNGTSYKPTTPAMAKGITDRILDFLELLAIPFISTVV